MSPQELVTRPSGPSPFLCLSPLQLICSHEDSQMRRTTRWIPTFELQTQPWATRWPTWQLRSSITSWLEPANAWFISDSPHTTPHAVTRLFAIKCNFQKQALLARRLAETLLWKNFNSKKKNLVYFPTETLWNLHREKKKNHIYMQHLNTSALAYFS